MKIAHITATFPPYLGGTGNVAYFNARELVLRGHEVHIYTPWLENTIPEEIIEGVHVHRLKPFIRFGNAYVLPDLWSLKNYDVIHLHFPFFGSELASLSAYKQHIPLVITYHQDVHLQGLLQFFEKFLRITVSRWVLNHASRVLFTSLDYCQASYARKILRGRENLIEELPNGVDPNLFCPGQIESDDQQ